MKKGTLIAIGTFVVLLVAVLATRDHGHVSEGMPSFHLGTFDPASVTSVELSGPVSLTLKKEGTGWTVTSADGTHPADEGQVNNLLGQLKDVKVGNFITDRPDRQAELQLDETRGEAVKVMGGSGLLLAVVFGRPATAPASGSYLRGEKGNEVFLSPSYAAHLVRNEAKRWRKHTFFPAPAADLTRITTKFEDGSSVALEAVDGGWSLAAGTATPADFRFDAVAAGRVANALAGLSATDFADGMSEQAAGLAGPHITVQAQRKDGTAVVTQIGHPAPTPNPDGGAPVPNSSYAVRVDGDAQIYLVAPFQAQGAIKHVEDLRDTSLLAFDPSKAEKVSVTAGGKVLATVAKTNGTWAVSEPKTPPTTFVFDPMQVTTLLNSLRGFRAAKVATGVTAASAGLTKPTLSIDIALEGEPAQRLVVGGAVAGQANQLYAEGSTDKLIYELPAASTSRFERGLQLFQKVPHMPPGHGGIPGMGGPGGMQGLDSLPPDLRAKIEAQLRQQGMQTH